MSDYFNPDGSLDTILIAMDLESVRQSVEQESEGEPLPDDTLSILSDIIDTLQQDALTKKGV